MNQQPQKTQTNNENEQEIKLPEKYKNMRSEAKERKILFKKYNKIIGETQKLSNFKEPCAILLRRTGQGEWLEDVTKGKFEYTHSDGTRRFIIITGKPQDMKYANRTFKLFILHEDFPLPIPEDPLYTTETVSLMLEQALISSQKLKNRDWAGKTNFVKAFGVILAIIGAFVILYVILKPATPPPQEVIVQTGQTILQNVTTLP